MLDLTAESEAEKPLSAAESSEIYQRQLNEAEAKLDAVGKLLQEKIDAYGGQGNSTVAGDFHEVLMELEWTKEGAE